MTDDTYPGIEIRVRSGYGEFLNHRSDVLHYELRKMWLMQGCTGDEWFPVGGTMLRAVLVEIRAVDVPAPPRAPSYPHELFGLDAGEAAEIHTKIDGQAAELAGADHVDGQAPVYGPSDPNCSEVGDTGELEPGVDALGELEARGTAELGELERYMTPADRAELQELTRRLAALERRLEAAKAAWHAAGYRPAPSSWGGEDDGAGSSLTEPVSEPARARRPRPRNIGIARIVRLARFRSGR